MRLLHRQSQLPWGELARIKEMEGWDSVAFDAVCVFGLSRDGTLHGIGVNLLPVSGVKVAPILYDPYQLREGPQQIGRRRDWVAIGASNDAAAGLTADGVLWSWGWRVDAPKKPKFTTPKPTFLQKVAQSLSPFGIRLNLNPNPISGPQPDYETSRHPTAILQFRTQDTD